MKTKHFSLYITFIILLSLTTNVHAQVPVQTEPLVNQYIADTYQQRSTTWWKALEQQLVLNLETSSDNLSAASLQNVIFFATLHADKVSLKKTVPALMEIYCNHTNESFRIMALSALDAIGDDGAMRALFHVVETEPAPDDRLHRLTVAVLYDHYQGR